MKRLIIIGFVLLFVLSCATGFAKSKKKAPKAAPVPTLTEYERGYNDALITLMLLTIELNMKGEAKTWNELLDICRQRNNVRKRPVRVSPPKKK